ncbi:ABC transporter substrate-binding protein [Bradyrhizobium sp. GCM10028915]|uniref:ABC transporter substrate-binding protein n=1 Tax=Bradyrhizobium sp. GCM10028915 TaxID=3273385 RepID=UPI00361160EF
MRRRAFLLGLTLAGVVPPVSAQQPKLKRMAIVSPAAKTADMTANSNTGYYRAFFQELSRLGYIEGQNILIERYSGGGETARYAQLAADVVGTHPDLIVSTSTPIAMQLKKVTQNIPVVSLFADPIAMGIVSTLGRPGGNITGASIDAGLELQGKRFQLLAELIPNLSRVHYLASDAYWERAAGIGVRLASQQAGIPIVELPLGRTVSQEAYQDSFRSIERNQPTALMVSDEGEHLSLRHTLVELVTAQRLPASYPFRDFVEAGGLMSYSVELSDLFRLMASQVAAIFRGGKPAEIPVQQPTKFELAINVRAAKALTLNLSPSFLARADHVIE